MVSLYDPIFNGYLGVKEAPRDRGESNCKEENNTVTVRESINPPPTAEITHYSSSQTVNDLPLIVSDAVYLLWLVYWFRSSFVAFVHASFHCH